MKPTEFWTWSLKGDGGRRYKMRGKYTEATAFCYWPEQDPQKVAGSLEVRNLPETSEELQETHPGSWLNYPKSVTSTPALAQPEQG